MTTLKIAALTVGWFAMLFCAVCLATSVALWQVAGMFWYGLGLIVTGGAFRLAVGWFLRD
jgi:hypothetical protein